MKYREVLGRLVGEEGSLWPPENCCMWTFQVGGTHHRAVLVSVEEDFVIFKRDYGKQRAIPLSLIVLEEMDGNS